MIETKTRKSLVISLYHFLYLGNRRSFPKTNPLRPKANRHVPIYRKERGISGLLSCNPQTEG